jgi:DNA-binding transcriptional ArsR family regulator
MSTVIPEPRSIATKISVLFESSRVEVLLSLRNGPRTARELGDSLDLSAVSSRSGGRTRRLMSCPRRAAESWRVWSSSPKPRLASERPPPLRPSDLPPVVVDRATGLPGAFRSIPMPSTVADPKRIRTVAQSIKSVAEPTRLEILSHLAEGSPMTTSELAARIHGSTTTILGQHLAFLVAGRFVEKFKGSRPTYALLEGGRQLAGAASALASARTRFDRPA